MSARMTEEALRAHMATHDRSNSWWLKDAMGIEVSRVCDECEETVKDRYDLAIFGAGSYTDVVDEAIEPEGYY